MRLVPLIGVFLLAVAGCSRRSNVLDQYDMNCVLKISVLKSGDIFADGTKVTLPELDSLIAANAQKKGVVWYYREAAKEEPPPQAMQVIELVVKHKRPIRMSSKADFSDSVEPGGEATGR